MSELIYKEKDDKYLYCSHVMGDHGGPLAVKFWNFILDDKDLNL